MNQEPLPNGANGRGPGGRFAKGNGGGPGNPNAKRVAELRSTLFQAVTPADLKKVVAALLKKAKSGDVASIRELLQRLLGPPEAVDLLERLDAVEAKMTQLDDQRDAGIQRGI
jgi:hypothetical protein